MAQENLRQRSVNADDTQIVLNKVALQVFVDMGYIDQQEYEETIGNVSKAEKLIASMPDLYGDAAKEFSERFVSKIMDDPNSSFLDLVPPATLAKAYTAVKERLADADLSGDDKERHQGYKTRLENRIDELIGNFAEKVGWHFVDTTNIADVNSGYREMFDAREPDLEPESVLSKQIEANRTVLDEYIAEYDKQYGIVNVNETLKSVQEVSRNYDAATKTAMSYEPGSEMLKRASNYKFLDGEKNQKPQFVDENGEPVVDYQDGYGVYKDGELQAIIDLARHDYALHHVGSDTEDVTEEELQKDLDNGVLFKLFEIDNAEKFVQGALESPDKFTNPEHFQEFLAGLDANGGQISENGYNAAMDAQVNKTAGFAGRIKQKLGKFASSASGFFQKVFEPIKKIDKRTSSRFKEKERASKRQKRVEYIKKILLGFGCAALISAAITTVAAAAAATAGVSLAASIATIGVVAGIGVSAVQIHKWRQAQRAAGKDDSVSALLKDGQMLASLGTTALASIAMIFGAAGLQAAAVTLGFGALTLGAGNNALQTFKDAKSNNFSTTESVVWALANSAAVVLGGITGRATATVLIDGFNASHPDNTFFQQEKVTTVSEKVGTETTTEQVYNPEAVRNARAIAESWYRDDPELLQERVAMVKAYNAAHGTNIDPYRAVMIAADAGGQTADNMALHVDGGGVIHSGGNHTVLTENWGNAHGFSTEELNAMRTLFDDGQLSEAGMKAISKADHIISPKNEIGSVSFGDKPHYDGVLPQNTTDANGNPVFNTYADGEKAIYTNTETQDVYGDVEHVEYTQVDVPRGYGTFGSYTKPKQLELQDREGALADKLIVDSEHPVVPVGPVVIPEEQEEQEDEPVVPVVIPEEQEEQEDEPVVPEVIPEEQEEQEDEPVVPEEIPEEQEEQEETVEPKYLRITRSEAYKLRSLDIEIEKTKRQLSDPKLGVSKQKKLQAELKKHEQELRTLKNKLGNPQDKDTLLDAMYWAFRKEDIENLQKELEKLEALKHKDKFRLRDIELTKKLLETYKQELPSEDQFYDPVAVKFDKISKRKLPVDVFTRGAQVINALDAQAEQANQSNISDGGKGSR